MTSDALKMGLEFNDFFRDTLGQQVPSWLPSSLVSPKMGAGSGVGVGLFMGRGMVGGPPSIDDEKIKGSTFLGFLVSKFQQLT